MLFVYYSKKLIIMLKNEFGPKIFFDYKINKELKKDG